jgi:hypothetical protein
MEENPSDLGTNAALHNLGPTAANPKHLGAED